MSTTPPPVPGHPAQPPAEPYVLTTATPPPRRRTGCWIAVGLVGCGLLVVVLVVAGVFGLGMLGMGVFEEQVEDELRGHPAVLEHLGQIEDLDVRMMDSLGESGPDVFVFDAKGTKGEGRIVAECVTIDEETEDVRWAVLELPSGERIELIPRSPGAVALPGSEVESDKAPEAATAP